MEQLIAPLFNFFLLVFLLGWKTNRSVKDFVSQREKSFREDFNQIQDQLKKAAARESEFSSKIVHLDDELATLRAQAQIERNERRESILAEAEGLALQMERDANQAAEQLHLEMKRRLQSDLNKIILEQTEKLLTKNLKTEDQAKFQAEFSQNVNKFSNKVAS